MADFDKSNLHDPSSYNKAGGRTLRNYSYKVEITSTSQIYGTTKQYVTVSTNEVMGEDAILAVAESMARGTGKSGIAGEIENIEITDALRSGGDEE